jgi:hypothetical protein
MMKAEDIIREIKDHASEWIEMSPDPSYLIAWILAQRVVKLSNYIDYLEKRLQHGT